MPDELMACKVDKTGWPYGPWMNEPDFMTWVDEGTGFTCIITRDPEFGYLNGYVAIPEGHPFHQEHYSRIPDEYHEIHGDLTFSDWSRRFHNLSSKVWLLGFDCNGSHDYAPGINRMPNAMSFASPLRTHMDQYKNLEYVKLECLNLAYLLSRVVGGVAIVQPQGIMRLIKRGGA